MGFDYTKLAKTAQTMLDKFGEDWTLRSIDKGVYDPANNSQTYDTINNYTVKAVRENYDAKQIDNTVVMCGDIKLLVEAKTLNEIPYTPTTHDQMLNGSSLYQIVNVKPTKPADIFVLYELQLRH